MFTHTLTHAHAHTWASAGAKYFREEIGNSWHVRVLTKRFGVKLRHIHSFIHLENLCSAPSRKLLRGASSPTTVKKISFKQPVVVEQRHSIRAVSGALLSSSRLEEAL